MKTSYKMIFIFSVLMIAAVSFFAIYATHRFQESTDAFDAELNASRLQSLGEATTLTLEQQIDMMDLTIDGLLESPTLMATINQFVRDDSEEGKMASAAQASVLQYLYHTPLVDSFHWVSFYTRSGLYINSRQDQTHLLKSGSPEVRNVIGSLPFLAQADADPTRSHILGLHYDRTDGDPGTMVFGVIRAVMFHDNQLGYFEVTNTLDGLNEIFSVLDNEALSLQAVFDDGTLFYTRNDLGVGFPGAIPENEITVWTPEGSDARYNVMRVHSERLGLNLFMFQNIPSTDSRNREIVWGFLRIGLNITIPMIILIVLISRRLTWSIRAMTKKVQQTPVEQVLDNDPEAVRALTETVTRPHDAELHSLEHVFNDMMLRLRESAANEIVLREGALQAQFSALQSQINPHFVYNTLNIISAKSMETGNLEVIEICDRFAAMLRYSTDTRSRTATLAEEIENVRSYLYLAKSRYEDFLEFTIDIPEDLTGITVPKLTLQPIVENALTHGYDGQNMQRRLTILGRREAKNLVVEVSDNGTGFSPEVLSRLRAAFMDIESGKLRTAGTDGHIGLANTYLRLYYYSQGTMRISIENRDGAVVRLTFPC